MKITEIEISNFKSLVDFNLKLSKFNCLIGLNGSGKSTVLQCIDFLSQLVIGDIGNWLKQRNWKPTDLKTKIPSNLASKQVFTFKISFKTNETDKSEYWTGTYNLSKKYCTSEEIHVSNYSLKTDKSLVSITDTKTGSKESYQINTVYEGSILSSLKEELLPDPILKFKKYILCIKSLELLSPEYLRMRTRDATKSLMLGGQNLSSFLHSMSPYNRQKLIDKLKKAYPRLKEIVAKALRFGWKKIEISEVYPDYATNNEHTITTEARHINDGMLRLIAILSELTTSDSFVLFDEIENGFNPELIEFLIDTLTSSSQQIIVTTHSPMILNYLEDNIAESGVNYLYKTTIGHTKSIPFFTIPSLAEKLHFMGPGEAFADTNLTNLADEIKQLNAQEQ